MRLQALAILAVSFWGVGAVEAQGAKELRQTLGDDKLDEVWIFDDLDAGYRRARQAGKPLLVAFR